MNKACECGSSAVGSPKHDWYCPLSDEKMADVDIEHDWGTWDMLRRSCSCIICHYEYTEKQSLDPIEKDNIPACPKRKP